MAKLTLERWALVLAGGDGTRLKSLTRQIVGREMPKQFCPIMGAKSLLEETLDRLSPVVAANQTIVSVNQQHRRYYRRMAQGGSLHEFVEEPANRGTAPAILHALLHLYHRAPNATLGIFPSDHYIGDLARFVTHLDSAFDAARGSEDAVVLLGADASAPEQAYGWIEADASGKPSRPDILRVRRFVEKPNAQLAMELWKSGAWWNTFIMVGRVSAFLQMYLQKAATLYANFRAVAAAIGTVCESQALTRLYEEIEPSCFSTTLLQQCAHGTFVLPMSRVRWCDLGEPQRVMRTIQSLKMSAGEVTADANGLKHAAYRT
ncbi:MAG TPA: sugar phosphate nucleotidyltransferase [Candidatus Binataceae bacterium]|nr:sugar phosphate nucleotidyltransferase [Candidatus Binataceae bacterium]